MECALGVGQRRLRHLALEARIVAHQRFGLDALQHGDVEQAGGQQPQAVLGRLDQFARAQSLLAQLAGDQVARLHRHLVVRAEQPAAVPAGAAAAAQEHVDAVFKQRAGRIGAAVGQGRIDAVAAPPGTVGRAHHAIDGAEPDFLQAAPPRLGRVDEMLAQLLLDAPQQIEVEADGARLAPRALRHILVAQRQRRRAGPGRQAERQEDQQEQRAAPVWHSDSHGTGRW